jgi:hypothetical protein
MPAGRKTDAGPSEPHRIPANIAGYVRNKPKGEKTMADSESDTDKPRYIAVLWIRDSPQRRGTKSHGCAFLFARPLAASGRFCPAAIRQRHQGPGGQIQAGPIWRTARRILRRPHRKMAFLRQQRQVFDSRADYSMSGTGPMTPKGTRENRGVWGKSAATASVYDPVFLPPKKPQVLPCPTRRTLWRCCG